MSKLRAPAVLLAASATAGLLAAGASASTTTTRTATVVQPRLVAVRAAHHPGADRIVFEFAGPLPASRGIGYVPAVHQDGSGAQVHVAGRAILRVRFENAVAHDESGRPTAPGQASYALPNLIEVEQAGDFEGVVTYGIGLAQRQPFHVSTLTRPSRVVIDVKTNFARSSRAVYFVDRNRVATGATSYAVPVRRQVPAAAPATGVMDRLFAGPTPAERGRGLLLVRSRANGFTGLSVADRIARVRLTGGCSSGGSTITIADEITPSLRQFPNVRWVKIHDPQGRTAQPTGRTDSVPRCLQP